MDHPQGLGVVEKLVPVEAFVFFLGHVLLGPLPDGHHGVQGLHLGVGFILRGLVFLAFGLLHRTGLGDLHADGVADIVGVLAHQGADLVLIQIFGVLVLLGVGLQSHDDVGAGGILLGFLDGIAVSAVGNPLPGGILAVFLGDYGDGRGHHEGGVEAHAELTDDVNVLFLLHGLLEAQGAGLGNGAQVLFHLFPGHTDAVIGDGQGPVLRVPGDGNGELIPVDAHLVIGEGGVGQLVDGIGGIGDDFPEEDLPVGIDGVDHQVQQTLGLGFELLLFHSKTSRPYLQIELSCCNVSTLCV